MSSLPRVDRSKCTLCGLCVESCPCHAIELTELGLVFHCQDTCCSGVSCSPEGGCWCLCEEVCPEGAINCPFEIVFEGDDCQDAALAQDESQTA